MSKRIFRNQQHKFRGLVSTFKSQRFVKETGPKPASRFRQSLRELLLFTRKFLHASEFDQFLNWINNQTKLLLPELSNTPIEYDDLSGVIVKAPVVSLEQELLWIAARIRAEAKKINDFRSRAEAIEHFVFIGLFDKAIDSLEDLDRKYGASFWSIQLRIALEQQAGGLERQKRYTADVRRVYKKGLLNFIAYYTSARNEDKATILKYLDDINVQIEGHRYFEPFVKTYMHYRLAGKWPILHARIADVLRVEQSHSIFDIYETSVSLIQEIIRRNDSSNIQTLIKKFLLEIDIQDFRLTKALLVLCGEENASSLPVRKTEASDALLGGDAAKAALISRRMIRSGPIDPWQFIYLGFALSHTTRQRKTILIRPQNISSLIGRIQGRQETSLEAITQLEKLMINFKGLPLAVSILDLIKQLQRSNPDNPWAPWLIGLNSRTLGIEDFPNSKHDYVASLKGTQLTNAIWLNLHEPNVNNDQRPISTLFEAARLIRERSYSKAIEILESKNKEEWGEPLRRIVVLLLLHGYFSSGDRRRVIELIADEGAFSKANRRMIPIRSSLESYTWEDYQQLLEPLSAPIALHLLWSVNEKDTIASTLRFFAGAFLKESGFKKPSNLFEHVNKYPRHQLIYFLRSICVQNILDVTRIFRGSNELIEERLAICANLCELDPINVDIYEEEMATLRDQQTMEEGKYIVDRSRIYVDTDALSRWAFKELSEDYARYQDLLAVNVKLDQDFKNFLKEILDQARYPRQDFKPESEADALLLAMLGQLKEEFISNPNFGLDFYLSKRIRHQSFIGHIRGPVESSHIITTRESESGGYHPNTHWLDQFESISNESKAKLSEAFLRFSERFDETLISAKNKKFQILSPENPDGIIFQELPPQLIRIACAVSAKADGMSTFIHNLIAVLWISLEPSLVRAKTYITEDLKTQIVEIFDEFRAALKKYADSGPALNKLNAEIGRSLEGVQRALDDAAQWFSRADIDRHKRFFELKQVVDIAIQNVLSCQRGFNPLIETKVNREDYPMTPSALISVNDVLFVALDNVRAHSKLKAPKIHITVDVNEDGNTFKITVLSDTRTGDRKQNEENLNQIRSLIQEGAVGRHTRREGGSGFLKLAADVLRNGKGKIDFGYRDSGQFELSVVDVLASQPTQ